MRFLLSLVILFLITGCKQQLETDENALKKAHELKEQIDQKIKDEAQDADELSEDGDSLEGDGEE